MHKNYECVLVAPGQGSQKREQGRREIRCMLDGFVGALAYVNGFDEAGHEFIVEIGRVGPAPDGAGFEIIFVGNESDDPIGQPKLKIKKLRFKSWRTFRYYGG